MNKDDIKPGMVVKLASGGPQMTTMPITSGEREGTVPCWWFDKDGICKRANFWIDALVPVTAKASRSKTIQDTMQTK